jgi:hypothetical protein
MNLELTDEEAATLERELRNIIDNDRYPFSPRIRTLQEIRDKIRPEPIREPLPPWKHYEPPAKVGIADGDGAKLGRLPVML